MATSTGPYSASYAHTAETPVQSTESDHPDMIGLGDAKQELDKLNANIYTGITVVLAIASIAAVAFGAHYLIGNMALQGLASGAGCAGVSFLAGNLIINKREKWRKGEGLDRYDIISMVAMPLLGVGTIVPHLAFGYLSQHISGIGTFLGALAPAAGPALGTIASPLALLLYKKRQVIIERVRAEQGAPPAVPPPAAPPVPPPAVPPPAAPPVPPPAAPPVPPPAAPPVPPPAAPPVPPPAAPPVPPPAAPPVPPPAAPPVPPPAAPPVPPPAAPPVPPPAAPVKTGWFSWFGRSNK